MALSIKDDEADRLARELALKTGETLTQTVVVALRERLSRLTPESRASPSGLVEEIERIGLRNSKRAWLDNRSEDEILGYDVDGLPH
jgi:antitoxin VapB